MKNSDVIKVVNFFQSLAFFHPLTCGNDSKHANLVAKELNDKIVLVCPNCDYRQEHIPTIAIEIGAYYLTLYDDADCSACNGPGRDVCLNGAYDLLFARGGCPRKSGGTDENGMKDIII